MKFQSMAGFLSQFLVPFDELPRIENPENDFIATANYKVTEEDYPYHISHHWAQPYRQMRIVEVLEQNQIFTAEDMMDLQMDIKNLHAEEFLPLFLSLLEGSLEQGKGKEKEALAILEEWDYMDLVIRM